MDCINVCVKMFYYSPNMWNQVSSKNRMLELEVKFLLKTKPYYSVHKSNILTLARTMVNNFFCEMTVQN